MTSRKQRIKQKHSEVQAKEARQVQIAVAVVGLLLVLGIGAYIATSSGLFSPAPVDSASVAVSGSIQEICDAATPAADPAVTQFAQAEQVTEAGVDYRAVMCTDAGAIYLDLLEDVAPVTVNNFVFLAQNNFYNNTIFHRVIADFMAQGGDRTGTGTGGPGYRFQDEFSPQVQFDRPYLLAMANSGPATNGSQFFITFVPTTWLNNAHTIFGSVISGQDSVDNIIIRDPSNANAPATRLEAVVIITDPSQVE